MNGDLHGLLRGSEGRKFQFTFADGAEMLAEVVSTSHLDADDTLVLLEVGAPIRAPAWQVHLPDIQSVRAENGRVLYTRR
jgi:hypothetical protein